MPKVVLSNFLIYCVINAFTPGPGNILALNTVTNYGYKKGKPLFFGIFTGYYVVQILCAIFVYGVNSLLPNVMEVMKYIGAAYILWLAIHIVFSKQSTENAKPEDNGLRSQTRGKSEDNRKRIICEQRHEKSDRNPGTKENCQVRIR